MALVVRWDWSKDLGPTTAGRYPAIFFQKGNPNMSSLGIYIDESGVYGEYGLHSTYYVVTLVLHDQSIVQILTHCGVMVLQSGDPRYTVILVLLRKESNQLE